MPAPEPERWRPVRKITVSDGRDEVSVLAVFDSSATHSIMPKRVHEALPRAELNTGETTHRCPTCDKTYPVLGTRVFRVKLPGIFTCCWTFFVSADINECRVAAPEMASIGISLLTATGQPARVWSAKCPPDPLDYQPNHELDYLYSLGAQSCRPMSETVVECYADVADGTSIRVNPYKLPIHGYLLQPMRQLLQVRGGRCQVKVFNPSPAHRVHLHPGTRITAFTVAQAPPRN